MAEKSLLYEIHKAVGAEYKEYFGFEVPERFSDPIEEHMRVRKSVGLIDLSIYSVVELTGADRVRFLNGIVSNDVKSLQAGSGVYAALLTTQGKIIADVRINALEDFLLLYVSRAAKDKTIAHLKKYIIADKVTVNDLDPEYTILSLQGPNAAPLLKAVLKDPMSPMQTLQQVNGVVDDVSLWIVRVSHTGEDGYDLVVPRANASRIWALLCEKGKPFELRPIGLSALNTLRLEAGIPWYGVDMDESHLLLEAGLERAISLTKGCYLGQETVARIVYRGHVNKRLVGLRIQNAVPQPKDKILKEGKQVGVVTSAALSPSLNHPIALAYVHRDFNQPGHPLLVETKNGLDPAEVVPLPFYKSSGQETA